MAGRYRLIGCLMVVAAVVMGAAAETYTVGNSLGWQVPPGGKIAYSTWAKLQTYEVGDTLVFNWNGTHDVARVSKADFENCTSSNVIGSIQTTSPANFTLESNATHYFICTVDTHCSLGQKLQIKFGDSGAPALAAGAFSVVLVALAVSFISYL